MTLSWTHVGNNIVPEGPKSNILSVQAIPEQNLDLLIATVTVYIPNFYLLCSYLLIAIISHSPNLHS